MDEHVTTDISRRSALKRIGAGAAVAWSAPVLMSVGANAGAVLGSQSTCTQCDTSQGFCDGQGECGFTPGLGTCLCSPRPDGTCYCWQYDDVSECANYFRCDTTPDCPAGMVCVPTCCLVLEPAFYNICVAPCGTPTQLNTGAAGAGAGGPRPVG
jgi:hypothetical protein